MKFVDLSFEKYQFATHKTIIITLFDYFLLGCYFVMEKQIFKTGIQNQTKE